MYKRAVAAFIAVAFSTAASEAAVITVNSTATVSAEDGVCTLIEAIDAANADTPSGTLPGECAQGAGADVIELQSAATYTLTAVNNSDPGPLGASDGDNGLPSITSDISILGFGSVIERSDDAATPRFRIFRVPPGGRLTLRDLTVRNGNRRVGGGTPQIDGGGILNQGSLVLDRVVLRDNEAINLGGGIRNVGQLTVTDSLFIENFAASEGSAIAITRSAVSEGSANILRSTFTGNAAFEAPGAITCAPGTLDVFSSTVSGNIGFGIGASNCDLSIVNTTITDNDLAGLFVSARAAGNPARIKNTIVSGQRSGPDCRFANLGALVSRGHNLDGDGSCTLDAPTDLPLTDPLLKPLADNAGPTPTHALRRASLAIDAGDDAACPATDQRGVARPQDGDRDRRAVCDIGAYERAAGRRNPKRDDDDDDD